MADITQDSKKSIPRFRRIFAFIIDYLILALICVFISRVTYSYFEYYPFLFQCIGTFICLFYFATFNSSLSAGNSIGKSICKIQVTDLAKQQITFFHSLLRSSIFIIPLCFSGYLQPASHFNLGLSLLVALFQSIIFACFYLAIFNRHSTQSLHDLFCKTQILREKQNNFLYQSVWKVHFVIISLFAVAIFAGNIFLYHSNQQQTAMNFHEVSNDILDVRYETRYQITGENSAENHILTLEMGLPEYTDQDQANIAKELTVKMVKKYPHIFSENNVNQVQFSHAYQFGIVKIAKTTLYDFSQNNSNIELNYNGTGIGFGL